MMMMMMMMMIMRMVIMRIMRIMRIMMMMVVTMVTMIHSGVTRLAQPQLHHPPQLMRAMVMTEGGWLFGVSRMLNHV